MTQRSSDEEKLKPAGSRNSEDLKKDEAGKSLPAQNRMGAEPEGKLLFSMALPMTISMLFQAFYNVVDSYFVAQLNQDAMNAVSLSFPMQSLLIAFAIGLLLCYAFGTLWFSTLNGEKSFYASLAVCVVPFILPDILKLALAYFVGRKLRPLIP